MILMLPFATQFTGLFNWFAFLYIKPNGKQICKEIFPPFFKKKVDVIIFVKIQG